MIETLDDLTQNKHVNIFITFETTHGGTGKEDHASTGQSVTDYAKEHNIKFYYWINRDPALLGKDKEMDPLPFTDTLDLDELSVKDPFEGEVSLWKIKEEVLEIYASSVPKAYDLAQNPAWLEMVQHEELYRQVN